ncbi:MAG: hypothetical protein LBJ72_14070 [Dysgonamonadaceae bacterium]|nr:hypothetical protein [Dysgonamonadaceae bacterium]
MRTKRSWFIIVMAIVMSGVLTGCLDEGQNSQDFPGFPAYITQRDQRYFMENSVVNVYADMSGITTDPYSFFETFGIAWYNINYDTQPAGTDGINIPYTASVYQWLPVETGYLNSSEGDFSDFYTDTIIDAYLYFGQLLRDHAFFVMTQNSPEKREYRYTLTHNLDSTASQNNIPALYVQAEISSDATGSPVAVLRPFAFDMSMLLSDPAYAEDVKIGGVDCEQVKFNLYYQSGVDKTTGKPIFTKAVNEGYPGQPFEFFRIKPQITFG